eukprot:60921-Pleurochrysis_carterae.AAC.6
MREERGSAPNAEARGQGARPPRWRWSAEEGNKVWGGEQSVGRETKCGEGNKVWGGAPKRDRPGTARGRAKSVGGREQRIRGRGREYEVAPIRSCQLGGRASWRNDTSPCTADATHPSAHSRSRARAAHFGEPVANLVAL